MAEALGLTASAIAVAAFAGQLAQGAAFLYNIIHTYKDAPKEIQRLFDEIGVMRSILVNIEAFFNDPNATPDPDLSLALRLCESVISDLTQDLAKLGTTQIAKTRKRILKKFKSSLRLADLARHAAALERAKSTLLQCCAGQSWAAQVTTSATLQAVQASVDGINQAVVDTRQAVTDTRQAVVDARQEITDTRQAVEALEPPISRIELSAAGTQQSLATLIQSNTRVEGCQLKTYTVVDRLESETLSLKQEILATRSIPQDIANQVKNCNSELREALTHDLERVITVGLRDLREEIRQDRARPQPHNDSSLSPTQVQASNCQPNVSSGLRPQERYLQPPSTSRWVRKSSTVTWNRTAKHTLFGTLIAQTVNTSYTRASFSKPNDKVEDTMAPSSYGTIVRPAPNWSLRSVSVIPYESEIITACRNLDVFRIRELFESGQASPFDVTDNGRNLLGNLINESGIENHLAVVPAKRNLDEKLERLFTLLAMLLDYGIDAGEIDIRADNPLTLFISYWLYFHYDASQLYEDLLLNILRRLLGSARSDPLAGFTMITAAVKNDQYLVADRATAGMIIALPALQQLVNQDAWYLHFANPLELRMACSPGYYGFPGDVREFVGFWVTSTDQEVRGYLHRKERLIQMLIQHVGKLSQFDWAMAPHFTIHGGAEVIALLTEHSHGNQGAPWLLHRFRKLVLVRKFMLHTLTLLLRLGGKALAYPELLDLVSEHANSHDARTFCVWKTALQNAAESLGKSRQEQCPNQDSNQLDDWETEGSCASDSDSGWETVEEWEEGYSLETAVDREKQRDNGKNPAVNTCGRKSHRGGDINPNYDEDYWEHVYSRFLEPDCSMYSRPKKIPQSETLKKLKGAANAVRDFISFIV